MTSVLSAITNTIAISQFNRGLAGKIFADVKRSGAKVVMKNNTAECVLLSPKEYTALMDEVNDARLLSLATERMAHSQSSEFIPAEQVYKELGIRKEELTDAGVYTMARKRIGKYGL